MSNYQMCVVRAKSVVREIDVFLAKYDRREYPFIDEIRDYITDPDAPWVEEDYYADRD